MTPLAINTVESLGAEEESGMSGSDKRAARQCSAYAGRGLLHNAHPQRLRLKAFTGLCWDWW